MNNKSKPHIIFPIYDHVSDEKDREIIQMFLQRYRDINFMRSEVKVFNAIEKTADLSGNSDGVIAKILVDNGLRASRRSLPQDFLDHIDNLTLRMSAETYAISHQPFEELIEFWLEEGGDEYSFIGAPHTNQKLPSFLTA